MRRWLRWDVFIVWRRPGGRRILSYKIFPLLYDLTSRKCVQKKKPAFSCIGKSRPLNWRTNNKKKKKRIHPPSSRENHKYKHVIAALSRYPIRTCIYICCTLQHTYRTYYTDIIYVVQTLARRGGLHTHIHETYRL